MSTWEVLEMEVGHIAADYYENSLRVIVMRGPASLCAYVGVPLSHPLAGHAYDDLPVAVHGGLTYSKKGEGDQLPEGFWWYGWDYAHSGDRCVHDYREYMLAKFPLREDEVEWTVDAVKKETWSVTYDFEKLMRLSEKIATKALGWKETIA